MQKNLVIVESPAKAKTIEKFLGADYKVMSSYGHICDLKKKDLSINIDTFEPIYEIPSDKKKVVSELKEAAKKAEMVWLASDEDREGEAISWHLFETLGLKPEKTKRIVFHEITKNAILHAIETPRDIDTNLVYAQQARRVLDRIVGFKLSPILWRKVKPALSAGRVQSVAVRLIVEREREIKDFVPEASYRVVAIFRLEGANGQVQDVRADYSERFKTKKEAYAFLEKCKGADFKVKDITTKPLRKLPAPPFTTSTMQQEATRKFGFTVMQTMMLAQRLYESGKITYMRTDSVNLSTLCIDSCRKAITESMGEEYVKSRQYTQKAKGAQEAHEAIRPTYMDNQTIDGTAPEKRLYELIWKRTIASQMADAEIEKTTVSITAPKLDGEFTVTGETVKFDGFLRVYRESRDDDSNDSQETQGLPEFKKGQTLEFSQISAYERFTQHPQRFNEAALVHKMEELGIGRPSTYAPTIGTIQQREYVLREDIEGTKRECDMLRLENGDIKEQTITEVYGTEKSKLVPTDIGMVVNDFLIEYFPDIMNYNFTAQVEKEFDDIADGDKQWKSVISAFYDKFSPAVNNAMTLKNEHKVGERILGNDPISGKPVSVKIGRYGPIVQIGSAEDDDKPRFAQMKKGQTIETITLDEALELFRLPRTLGEFEGFEVTIGTGRFGPYIRHDKFYVSLTGVADPLTITFEEAVHLIQSKRESESKKVLKSFPGNPDMEVMNGRYGAYIAYQGSNYKIPRNMDPTTLTEEECQDIIKRQIEKTGQAPKRRIFKTKK
ncbi:MAG: type I DNA topoisomerase [Bacteroidaceae bacterium]|nr:type I DNA topoisomerase [Bacteroidaceae bacterium]MBR6856625.1 type I DNA topoisomerase [Bacteroidaceae bacterium]